MGHRTTHVSVVPGKHTGKNTMRRDNRGRHIVLRPAVLNGQRLALMCRKRAVRAPNGISFRFAIITMPAMARASRWTAVRPSRLQIVVRLVVVDYRRH